MEFDGGARLVKKKCRRRAQPGKKEENFLWVAPLGAVSRQIDTGRKIGPNSVLHPTQTHQIERDLDSKYVGQLKMP
jgi:hypothetical protein